MWFPNSLVPEENLPVAFCNLCPMIFSHCKCIVKVSWAAVYSLKRYDSALNKVRWAFVGVKPDVGHQMYMQYFGAFKTKKACSEQSNETLR